MITSGLSRKNEQLPIFLPSATRILYELSSDKITHEEGMKRNKQVNAILYAIEEYPEIGRTKLMKFVFSLISSSSIVGGNPP